jgi:hypothetical protein
MSSPYVERASSPVQLSLHLISHLTSFAFFAESLCELCG